jgi:hypothetical protein
MTGGRPAMPIKINHEETNLEILARIAKATARKYDCSVTIDFQNGNRRIEFVGDKECQELIANTVETFFKRSSEEPPEETSHEPDHP